MRSVAFLFIIQFLYSSCSEAQPVHIQVKWEHGPESVQLLYLEDAATAKSNRVTSAIDPQTGLFTFLVEIQHPTLLYLSNQSFIVLPGDNVNINVVEIGGEPRLNFDGPKKLEHNFLTMLVDKVGWYPEADSSIDQNTITTYKINVTNHFDSCLVFLDDYFTIPSESFEIARDLLTVQYYQALIYPVATRMISKERLPRGYFDPLDFKFFTKADLLGFRDYIIFLLDYNKYFYSLDPQTSMARYNSETILAEIQSAISNYKGEVKDHLLLSIFSDVSQNGTGQNRPEIDKLYTYLKESFSDEPLRMMQIDNFKRDFDKIDKVLPKGILSQQMITQAGTHVSLNEIFASNEAIYIDFWASWCGPCIGEMPHENQLISEFKGKPIKFVLVSLDKDAEEWRKGIAKTKVDGTHYLIPEASKSALIQYLSFRAIPRYIIFDKNGRLISRDAPRPSRLLKDKSILNNLLN